MTLPKPASLRQRRWLGVALAVATLLFLAALLYASLLDKPQPWPTSVKHAIPFALPLVVYLVCRYLRASIAVKLLALGLLATATFMALSPHGMPDPLLWAKVAGLALCGLALLLGVPWASYLWYLVAAALIVDWGHSVRQSYVESWQRSTLLKYVVAGGLLYFMVCAAGTAAVLADAKVQRSERFSSISRGLGVSRGLAALCATVSVIVLSHWFATRVPDPAGIELLHPRIKSEPALKRESAHTEPWCNKISYCGLYVQVSCRPESDGPVMYYDNTTGRHIVSCSYWGVACENRPISRQATNCPSCPPPEWTRCIASRGEPERATERR